MDLILELEDERIDRSSIASLNYTTVRAYERLSASLCAQLFAYEHFNLSRPTIREVLWQKEVLKVLDAKFLCFVRFTTGELQAGLIDGLHDTSRVIFINIGTFDTWPCYFVNIFMKERLHYKDRFVLTLFLLHNGTPPDIVERFFTLRLFTPKKKKHVYDLVKAWKHNVQWCRGKYTWCLFHKRYEFLDHTICNMYIE